MSTASGKRRGRPPKSSLAASTPTPTAPRRSARNTRQASNAPPEPRASGETTAAGTGPGEKKSWPTPARRGAKRSGPISPSIGDLTRLPGSDEESDTDDTIQIAQTVTAASPRGASSYVSEYPVYPDDDDDAARKHIQRDVMALSFADLEKATSDLVHLLEEKSDNSAVKQVRLNIKRRVFYGVREVFELTKSTPFLNPKETDWRESSLLRTASRLMVQANRATTLDIIERSMFEDEQLDMRSFLESLDASFPQLFMNPSTMASSAKPSIRRVVLSIRTAFFIERLDRLPNGANAYSLLALVFCQPTEEESSDYPRLFANGPFRSLGTDDSDEEEKLCSGRITQLVEKVKGGRTEAGMKKLRAEYPLDLVLDEVREWISQANADAQAEAADLILADPEPLEETDDEEEDEDESQPVRRLQDKGSSLFQNPESLAFLEERGTNRDRLPPSNQQQNDASRGNPRSTSTVLDQGRDVEAHATAARASNRRTPLPSSGSDVADMAQDDEFEIDERPVRELPRRPQVSQPRPNKRRRTDSASPSSTATRMAPPPLLTQPSSQPTAPPSTAPPSTMAALRQEKRVIQNGMRGTRREHTAAFRQVVQVSLRGAQTRTPWSDRDSEHLIRQIGKHQCRWANIQDDADGFEYPRNQQAYRDKARNLKVDFLLTDAILPPSFDHIALGKKEIIRIASFGKNPWRTEEDRRDGRATNTELPPDAD
ncbi:hypothetical protein S40293_01354 [Stachybotrys chartarum IBT 40293]|nr:hypothetical protein S40293_01354 [Stachybotrys chartarum IBT 40293]